MDVNNAMLRVADYYATIYNYRKIEEKGVYIKDDEFWGNRLEGLKNPDKKVTVCKYEAELSDEEKKIYEGKRLPKIAIDIFWGEPRLMIYKRDGTFACLTYKDNKVSEAQAFGENGLALAIEMRDYINELIAE